MKFCLYWFCNECWKVYLFVQLQQGKIIIKCLVYDCDILVDDVILMVFILDRFLKFLIMR